MKSDRSRRGTRRDIRYDEGGSLLIFNSKDVDSGQSTTGLDGRFVQSQLLITCLLQMNTNQTDREEFASRFREICEKNSKSVKDVDQFEKQYASMDSLWWYTRDSFLYRKLNEALRNQDIDLLFLFHFFIHDLEEQIQHCRCSESIDLYRGQIITKDELQALRNSINSLIAFNSFLSTSRNIAIAYIYAGVEATLKDPELEHVLFEIRADSRQLGIKPFADVSEMSQYPDEEEILIMLGAVFRVKEVVHDDNRQVWRIKMDLCSDDDCDVKSVVSHMGKQYDSMTDRLLRFAYVLIDMSHFKDAEKYLHRVLKDLPPHHPDIAKCHQALGKIYCEEGKYQSAHDDLGKALEFLRQTGGTSSQLAYLYNNIGEVYQNECKWTQALQSYKKALKLFRKQFSENDENIAWGCNNLGIIYEKQNNYQKADRCYAKALRIKLKVLPPGHPCLGNVYNNIGNIHYHRKEYDQALEVYRMCYDIFEKSLKSRHPSMARISRNIGLTYEALNQFEKAMVNFEKVLTIRKSILSPTHPDLLEIEKDITRISAKIPSHVISYYRTNSLNEKII